MSRIFVALSAFSKESPEPMRLLKASGHEVMVNTTGKRLTKPQLITMAADCDGVVAGLEPYDADVLAALPRLKCISRCGVGLDNIDLKEAQRKKITVLNTPDAVVVPVAELTIAMIFDLLRHVSVHTELMHRHQWVKHTGLQLAGKTIGIIGLGRIGRRVAELLIRLECKVIAVDIKPDLAWAKAYDVQCLDLDEVLTRSDVVSLHMTALEGQALHFSARHFAMMKKGSFLVNTARGSLVDEDALYQALTKGHLAGAALDVFKQEPYNGPLCDLPNVLLTPHVATLTQESRVAMEIEAVAQCLKELLN